MGSSWVSSEGTRRRSKSGPRLSDLRRQERRSDPWPWSPRPSQSTCHTPAEERPGHVNAKDEPRESGWPGKQSSYSSTSIPRFVQLEVRCSFIHLYQISRFNLDLIFPRDSTIYSILFPNSSRLIRHTFRVLFYFSMMIIFSCRLYDE